MSQKQAKTGAHHQKAQPSLNLSFEEQDWVQQQLTNYQPFVDALYRATFAHEVGEALSAIFAQSEQTQLALVKGLGQQPRPEAADLLTAIQMLTEIKEIRKEARRSLLRLEGAKVTHQWTVPPAKPALTQPTSLQQSQPPRFWKGFYTDTLAGDEMAQLILLWEEGEGYRSARLMGLLFDYNLHGIEDFFYETNLTKSQAERRLDKIRTEQFAGTRFLPCTLSEARHMLEDALEVLEEHGARPPLDFDRYRHVVDELLLNTSDALAENKDRATMTEKHEQDPTSMIQSLFDSFFSGDIFFEKTVQDFFDAWNEGNYGEAYDLLASDSPLRQGLSREAWVELREQWRAEAQPANFFPVAIEERVDEEDEDEEDEEDELDEDEELNEEDEDFEEEDEEDEEDEFEDEGIVDLCWSLEMNDTPLSERLPELPKATATYGETRRHWFWSSYQLRDDEDGKTRIVSMVDEGTALDKLSSDELRNQAFDLTSRFSEILESMKEDEEIDKLLESGDEEEESSLFTEALEEFQQGTMLVGKALHYYDTLIFRRPMAELRLFEEAADHAEATQDFERAACYLQTLANRFPEQRARALTSLANVQQRIAQTQEEKSERATRLLQLAEQNLRASLEQERTALALILLAQLLSHEYAKFDDAERLLHEAEKLSPSTQEALMIAVNYGMIAEYRNQTREAIEHYQRATTIAPDFPNLWNNIGYLQMNLEDYDEAEKSFLYSIDQDPQNTEAYIHLADLYTQVRRDLDGAEDVLLQGLEVADEDTGILGKLVEVYINKGDLKEAERFLEEAEDLSPDSSFVQDLRVAYDEARAEKRRAMKARGEQRRTQQTSKPKKRKK